MEASFGFSVLEDLHQDNRDGELNSKTNTWTKMAEVPQFSTHLVTKSCNVCIL
jgi:hypothetical protein